MIVTLLSTFVVSLAAVALFLRVARRRLLDRPGSRSSHKRPTPTGGGLPAALVGLVGTCALGRLDPAAAIPSEVLATALVVLTLAPLGLVDDALDLPRSVRLLVHVTVSVGVAWLSEAAHRGWPSLAFMAMGMAMAINFFNFMDGIDGLVGGTGCLVLLWLGAQTGDAVCYAMAAAYAGFLVFNLPPAKIFMGDAGSTTLGGLVGVTVLFHRSIVGAGCWAVLVPLLGDALYTLLRRALRRENVLRAHHSHLYQRLTRAGLSHGRVSLGYALATACCAAVGQAYGNWGAGTALVAWSVAVGTIEWYLAAKRVAFARPKA